MTKIIVLGASGSLGKHVAKQAVDGGHEVSVVVRTPSKLPASWRDKVQVHQADIATLPVNQLGALLDGHDVVTNTAGLVTDGERFVTLIAHIVSSIETIEPAKRPVTWFLAGAGLLDIGDTQRRGLELPLIKKTFWPHGENFKRLEASTLDFRMRDGGAAVSCPKPALWEAVIDSVWDLGYDARVASVRRGEQPCALVARNSIGTGTCLSSIPAN
jgi:putative NADH-flavin reductase